MNNPFVQAKKKAEEKAQQEAAAHQQRLERLHKLQADLSAQQEKRGLHIPHPLKRRKIEKEIKSLQKEVAAYDRKQTQKKKDKKTIFALIAGLLVLFLVIGIMAGKEKNQLPASTPQESSQVSMRSSETTTSPTIQPFETQTETIPSADTELPTETATSPVTTAVPPTTEPPTETEPVITEDSSFEIYYLDVGQGDAACVICDGHAMMIDGGNNSESSLIYSFLRSHEITYLDYIVASHPDADHIGGLSGALNYADVGVAFCTVTEHDTETFQDFTKYLEKRGREITIPEPGETFFLGCSKVTIVYPEAGITRSDNTSIALRIEYGDTSFFFTGDCESENEVALASGDYPLRSDVLKVAHHGSRYSTGTAILAAIQPSYAVISVGGDNTYGHPTEEVLSRLQSLGTVLFRTDIQGDIHCVSDGTTVTFDVDRNADFDTYLAAGGYQNYLDELAARETESPTSEEPSDRTTPEGTDPQETEAHVTYIVNINKDSLRFHYPDCPSVSQMKEKNKWYFTGTREELIEMGYVPCGRCHP